MKVSPSSVARADQDSATKRTMASLFKAGFATNAIVQPDSEDELSSRPLSPEDDKQRIILGYWQQTVTESTPHKRIKSHKEILAYVDEIMKVDLT